MKLYYCSTYYHALITLIKATKDNDEVDILLSNNIPGYETLKERLENSGAIRSIFIFDDVSFKKSYVFRSKIEKLFKVKTIIIEKVPETLPLTLTELRSYSDIYTYNDMSTPPKYLIMNHIKYHLLEDGEACLNRLIGIKEGIAAQLAGKFRSVRKGAEQAPSAVVNLAKDRFSQSLAWAYDTDVAEVYEVLWKNQADAGHFRLESYVKSDACMSATKPEVCSDGTAGSDVFCMFLRETEESVEDMTLSFPYLEYDIETGTEGYERSKWLRLASPIAENISLEQDIGTPFPKKECPMPPQLLGQNNQTEGQAVLEYQWAVEISAGLFRQDTLYLRLENGELTKGVLEEPDDKITALAQYQLERAGIMEMLQDDTQVLAAYNKFITHAEAYASKADKLPKRPVLSDSENSVLVKIGYPQGQEEPAILNLSDVAEHLGVKAENVVCTAETQTDGNRKIKVTICSLPVYKYYWMKPEAFLVRNENLFTEEPAETDEYFIFNTETMELPQLYIFADYAGRTEITGANLEEAVQAVLDKLQITGYPVHLNMTVYYEYPMLPGRDDIRAWLPVTLFPYFKTLDEIDALIKKCVLPDKEGGEIILDTNVYKDGTEVKVLHAKFRAHI